MPNPQPDPIPTPNPIPVICDRCRAEGHSEEDPFEAFGALLDFDPVPRRTARADGWDADVQRAFIAALSLTGSPRAAARAVGKAAYGADQLRRVPGNAGFLAAWDEAMAMAADERGRRLAEGLRAAAAEAAAGRRLAPAPWSGAPRYGGHQPVPPTPPPPDEAELARREADLVSLIETFHEHYVQRLKMERDARLSGEIIAADFYVRQVTVAEIWLDLFARDLGEDVFKLIHRKHMGPDRIPAMKVAETFFSRMLDEARRKLWTEHGDPERPPLYAEDPRDTEEGFTFLPLPKLTGGPDYRQQEEDQRRGFEEAARAQVEWEAQARRDYERRRDSAAES